MGLVWIWLLVPWGWTPLSTLILFPFPGLTLTTTKTQQVLAGIHFLGAVFPVKQLISRLCSVQVRLCLVGSCWAQSHNPICQHSPVFFVFWTAGQINHEAMFWWVGFCVVKMHCITSTRAYGWCNTFFTLFHRQWVIVITSQKSSNKTVNGGTWDFECLFTRKNPNGTITIFELDFSEHAKLSC